MSLVCCTGMSGESKKYTAIWQRRILANSDWLLEDLTFLSDLSDHLIKVSVFSCHDAEFVEKGGVETQLECNRRFLARLLDKGKFVDFLLLFLFSSE